ncbi:MAG: DUF4097 family beta strand repeat-containing protein [Clostridia bacterium]|nr:DUF4097 family beta strand repeat-containing protein [Clostridia bacterium]
MTKHEFLYRLDAALAPLPKSDRDDALRYYEDYFADAGAGNEARLIEELGSPEALADEIITSLGKSGAKAGSSGEPTVEEDGTTRFGGSVRVKQHLLPAFSSLCVELVNSKLRVLKSDRCALSWTTDDRFTTLEYRVKDGRLHIKEKPENGFPGGFHRNSGGGELTLYLAFKEYESVDLACVNSSMSVENVRADKLSASSVNGSVEASGLLAAQLKLHTVNGSVSSADVRCGQLKAHSVNGSLRLSGAFDGDVKLSTVNGSVALTTTLPIKSYDLSVSSMSAVYVNGRQLKRNGFLDMGPINIDNSASRTITAKTVHGSVRIDSSCAG